MNFNPISTIFDEETNMQHFCLYAQNMQQYAATVVFWKKLAFLLENISNDKF